MGERHMGEGAAVLSEFRIAGLIRNWAKGAKWVWNGVGEGKVVYRVLMHTLPRGVWGNAPPENVKLPKIACGALSGTNLTV